MKKKKDGHLFGPVPSRRLGLSLGVDLVPLKKCTQDCLYCQLGVSAARTMRLRPWVPAAVILGEIRERLEAGAVFDHLTFSGSGEPTLNSEIGEIIAGARHLTDRPLAVITNGTTLYLPEVRRRLLGASVVLPSLDAGSPGAFRRLNRPHPRLSLEKLVAGLVSFREEYTGSIWLEVMLVRGLNDNRAEMEEIRRVIRLCRPDRVHLNTVVRPPLDSSAGPLSPAEMEEAARFFGPGAEVIADFPAARGASSPSSRPPAVRAVLETLRRRPQTMEDLAAAGGINRGELSKMLSVMLRDGLVESLDISGLRYYRVAGKPRARPGGGRGRGGR